jgi:bacterioferritin-associated ferredoxin
MYLCICKGITHQQLDEALKSKKNASAKDVLRSLGVGSDCGCCLQEAIETLRENSGKSPQKSKNSPKK